MINSRNWALIKAALSLPIIVLLWYLGEFDWILPWPWVTHACVSRPDRPLRVGITDWAGFAGGVLANRGFQADRAKRGSFPFTVEFVAEEGQEAREAALSTPCPEQGVDLLWSSVQSWACELPHLLRNGVHPRAIMQVANARGAYVLVAGGRVHSLSDLRAHSLAAPRFTPAHWLAEQVVPNKDSIELMDSPEEVLDSFLKRKVDAAVLCERNLHRALKRDDAQVFDRQLDDKTDVLYILVAREDTLRDRPDILKRFIQAWLDGNQDAKSSSDVAVRLLREKRDDGSSEQATSDELGHVRFAGLAENMKLFGLDGRRPEFDDVFNAASQIWMSRGFVSPARSVDARDNRFLREIYLGTSSVGAVKKLCTPGAEVEEVDNIAIYFNPPGSYDVNTQEYGDDLGRIITSLKANPSSQACVEGYTDNTGTEARNATLSLDRAWATAEYLRQEGIGQNRVEPQGRGQSNKPPNSTPEAQAKNRRATIRVVKEGDE
jgi:outer membrane protein OmpA-like peptidoglycan-associated protein